MLELSLPEKLIAGKLAGLTNDRDFQISSAVYAKNKVFKVTLKELL